MKATAPQQNNGPTAAANTTAGNATTKPLQMKAAVPFPESMKGQKMEQQQPAGKVSAMRLMPARQDHPAINKPFQYKPIQEKKAIAGLLLNYSLKLKVYLSLSWPKRYLQVIPVLSERLFSEI